MLNLQIKNEEQFLLDGLKGHLKSQIEKLQKQVVDTSSFLDFGIESNTFRDDEERLLWMQSYTIQLRNAQYQLEWYEKQLEELCLEM